MKVKSFILRDSADSQFDDLVDFKDEQLLEDIYKKIKYVKQNIDGYTNEDIYKALAELGEYDLTFIGWLKVVEY